MGMSAADEIESLRSQLTAATTERDALNQLIRAVGARRASRVKGKAIPMTEGVDPKVLREFAEALLYDGNRDRPLPGYEAMLAAADEIESLRDVQSQLARVEALCDKVEQHPDRRVVLGDIVVSIPAIRAALGAVDTPTEIHRESAEPINPAVTSIGAVDTTPAEPAKFCAAQAASSRCWGVAGHEGPHYWAPRSDPLPAYPSGAVDTPARATNAAAQIIDRIQVYDAANPDAGVLYDTGWLSETGHSAGATEPPETT